MTQKNAREVLWTPPDPRSTPMWRFIERVNEKYGLNIADYEALYQWSIENVASFWEEVWIFFDIKASRSYDEVLPSQRMFPRPDFFSGALLNFAENLLFPSGRVPDPTSTAIITATERESDTVETSWEELREAVRRCSGALRASGLGPGDVVAGFVSNHVQALVAMLAAAAVGAIWTGISPDNGVSAVLDRLEQIKPSVLFADNGSLYNGKEWSGVAKTVEITAALSKVGLKRVVMIRNIKGLDLGIEEIRSQGLEAGEYEDFLSSAPDKPLTFEQLPPSHPLYVLYSSGTTGLPKAIVHTALGTLIQHIKEHGLHCSLNPDSRMLYYTTTSWMMWHWSVSALATGTSLVLYSGSPFRPHAHMSLPKLLSSLRVTHFGTSAAYLTALEANNILPAADLSLDLSRLQAIYSTASPLPHSTFKFVYSGAFPPGVHLASITGGTDIIALFGAPNPLLPLYAGEVQAAGLGMAVEAVDSLTGEPLSANEPGDLVCLRPFPSQPLTFFGPGGDEKYRAAYFDRFSRGVGEGEGVAPIWHHGDFVRVPEPGVGNLVMLGRSDGVLKPAGVRFGSAEIYNVLTRFFASEIEDALCVGRRREGDSDETVCLFVVTVEGRAFDEELGAAVRGGYQEGAEREACAWIEVAVKQILSGMQVKTNASVANPEALDWFREWAKNN
ncbi:related to acetoacetyl-CoA synthetase [Cephalotrichum gorgonifer]|uniref:Related to acetoacetyl-CoA synthetase n=1 Tax=Cephalotrichum gorgonifer TaxID=2041049 RepID=A0AAE8SW02_9PEZI|nr:related to acetoacetyl-CoA synthetase [Cephalotrichum gorgonifer]